MRSGAILLLILIPVLRTIGEKKLPTTAQFKRWEKYHNMIKGAEKEFVPCGGNCTCHENVIHGDLHVWKSRGGINKSDMKAAKEKVKLYYQIIDHRLYRSKTCMFPSRCSGIEHFILEIIEDLPNMEFVVNVHDYPRSLKHHTQNPQPVFSFSKVNVSYHDIMYPAWTFWEGGPALYPLYPRGLGRWDIISKQLINKAQEYSWEKKKNVAFFRGSRTSPERDPIVLLSRKRPELVDAIYTKNQAWKSKADTLGDDPAEPVHLLDHCEFKYLFNFRGVAASFRFKHLFLCDSLVFHVGADWLEFFYPAMKPWIHYIPVKDDMKEAEDLLDFFSLNDEVAKKIAIRGKDFIATHLQMKDVSCYWKKLLLQYADLLTYNIEKDNTLILITKTHKDEL